VIVVRGRHLPVRGCVSEEFIARALAAVPDGAECLALSVATKLSSCIAAQVNWGESHRDLEQALRDWLGTEAALGVCAEFWVADDEGLLSRAKGGSGRPEVRSATDKGGQTPWCNGV
jgi:hypothetical protein